MFGVQQLWYLVQCFSGDSDSEFLFSRFRLISWEKLDHHPVNIYKYDIYIYIIYQTIRNRQERGVEEVTAIALLQHLHGSDRARAVLLQLPDHLEAQMSWAANWGKDEARKKRVSGFGTCYNVCSIFPSDF